LKITSARAWIRAR